MNTNEKIARWLGYVCTKVGTAKPAYPNLPTEYWTRPDTGLIAFIEFDTDITLWHGEKGLLAEIEKQEKASAFIRILDRLIPARLLVPDAWLEGGWVWGLDVTQGYAFLPCRRIGRDGREGSMRLGYRRTCFLVPKGV